MATHAVPVPVLLEPYKLIPDSPDTPEFSHCHQIVTKRNQAPVLPSFDGPVCAMLVIQPL